MQDVLPQNNSQMGQNFSDNYKKGNHSNRSGGKHVAYCWSYNRGEKCKFDPDCKFVKRCSYCDASGHGQFECPKLKEKDKRGK